MDTDTPSQTPEPEQFPAEKRGRAVRKESSPYFTPVAVLLAGAMVAGAIMYSQGSAQLPRGGNVAAVPGAEQPTSAEGVQAVSKKDHVLGDMGADITLIEFSDFQCPFCSSLHPTLARIVSESSGGIKWIYRHFPLSSIHPNALPAALASECVAKYAGNDAFWKFAEELFKDQQQLGTPLYEKLSTAAGVSADDFASCMISEDTTAIVTKHLEDALASGGQGTPYVVIINKKGEKSSFSGALPYPQVVAAIDKARGN